MAALSVASLFSAVPLPLPLISVVVASFLISSLFSRARLADDPSSAAEGDAGRLAEVAVEGGVDICFKRCVYMVWEGRLGVWVNATIRRVVERLKNR